MTTCPMASANDFCISQEKWPQFTNEVNKFIVFCYQISPGFYTPKITRLVFDSKSERFGDSVETRQ